MSEERTKSTVTIVSSADILKIIPVRLKKIRNDNKKTMAEVSKYLGVSVATIDRWESMTQKQSYTPSVGQLILLAELYCVNLSYILGLDFQKNIDGGDW